jgi:hypothetical protein
MVSASSAYARGLQDVVGKLRGFLRDGREGPGAAEHRDQCQHDRGRQCEAPAQTRAGVGDLGQGVQRAGYAGSTNLTVLGPSGGWALEG